MYSDHVTFEIVGQIMIATLFLGTAIINSTTKVKQHAERMLALKVPAPYLTLWIGFIIQYTGGILILIDFWTELGVSLLIVFTITGNPKCFCTKSTSIGCLSNIVFGISRFDCASI